MCIRDSYTVAKFNKAVWSLNHLKKARISPDVLVRIYCTMLRPIIEFCSVVYHPMLTIEMSNDLERLQKMSLKIIHGFGIEYEELLRKSNLKTLEHRRTEAFKKFSNAVVLNERYESWFPTNVETSHDLRHRKRYCEFYARTNRLYNSPLYAMRRALNSEDINYDE